MTSLRNINNIKNIKNIKNINEKKITSDKQNIRNIKTIKILPTSKWNQPLKIDGRELEKNINEQQKEIKIRENFQKNEDVRKIQTENKLYNKVFKKINAEHDSYIESDEFDYSDNYNDYESGDYDENNNVPPSSSFLADFDYESEDLNAYNDDLLI